MARRIIVSQIAGRHRYAIPQALEEAGLLFRCYTDTTRHSVLGRLALLLSKLGIRSGRQAKVLGRSPQLPLEKLYSSDILFFKQTLAKILGWTNLRKSELIYTAQQNTMIKWGVGDADCVYNMYFENLDFLKYAKGKGLKVVVDIYEPPMEYKYLVNEIENNPEYSNVFGNQLPLYRDSHTIRMKYTEDMLSLADYYTVPSKFVIKSLREFDNFDESKVIYQPYTSSIPVIEYKYHPVKHRIIFVGSDPVRKGLIYCAKAATILKSEFPDLDFRVLGSMPDEIKHNPVFKDLNFIGFLNSEQLRNEYCSAEAYVFPTLFEGFAGTVIEAGSCGCPIITTECSGADTDEFPALFIPERSVDAIADSVRKIFENSEFRDQLSRSVFEYSKTLSFDNYTKGLAKLFERL